MEENYDLQEIHDTLVSIAHKAGEMIRSAHPTMSAAGEKKNCV
jgi:myo-inositol-1(or 4)-monophosphatase